jgi:hypothetical protein
MKSKRNPSRPPPVPAPSLLVSISRGFLELILRRIVKLREYSSRDILILCTRLHFSFSGGRGKGGEWGEDAFLRVAVQVAARPPSCLLLSEGHRKGTLLQFRRWQLFRHTAQLSSLHVNSLVRSFVN